MDDAAQRVDEQVAHTSPTTFTDGNVTTRRLRLLLKAFKFFSHKGEKAKTVQFPHPLHC